MNVRSPVRWLALILLAVAPAAASAQVRDVEPYHVVVTGDDVNLRCGDGTVWYSVATIDQGVVLRVDGEGFGWLRVTYPDGVPALVARDAAKYVPEQGVVELNQPSQLKAYNRRGSRLGDSWKNLLPRPLPPGATLRHLETLTDDADAPIGYLVDAPEEARGYISEQFTRRASDAEVAAWRAAQQRRQDMAQAADEGQPPAADGQPADQPSAPSQTAEAPPQQRPKVADAGAADEAAPDSSQGTTRGSADEPTATTADAAESARADKQEAGPSREVADAIRDAEVGEESPAQAADRDPAARPLPTIQALEEAFKDVLAAPIESAEIEPLIAEHRRLMAALAEEAGDPAAAAQRERLSARIEVLRIRLELQEDLNRMDEVRKRAASGAGAIEERIRDLQRRRPYTLVGRLTASAIYNGRRLPLMYRLQSIEGQSRRSIAYLIPDPTLDLNAKLGSIVGVEGEGRMDSGLGVRIVRPTRVDVLEPVTAAVDQE